MTTLEDKLLGIKRENYCSSSESECEPDSDEESEKGKTVEVESTPPPVIREPDGSSANTGPKGVIKDWQRYKQLESEQREEREREKLALIQKLSMTCRPEAGQEDPELDELLEDSFILEYSKRRMQEMFQKVAELPKFGSVINLSSGEEFLDAVDKENKNVTVVVHIYEEKAPGCKVMNESLKVSGVPALLVYKNGNLVGNYVHLTEEFGREFEASDVEGFLIENGVMVDNSCVPSLLK
ncbi:UNVERIFIED_CONTAM: hypothetical protein PYX00_008438 [Menopon gallinae]|uniref:Phosducin domain-containing protein n=1 Tax=Menopon gallinae TaxID=328185 RepID=A0AAW2HNQ3_9NEOP